MIFLFSGLCSFTRFGWTWRRRLNCLHFNFSSTMAMNCMNHHLHLAMWRGAARTDNGNFFCDGNCFAHDERRTDDGWRDGRNLKNHSQHHSRHRQSPLLCVDYRTDEIARRSSERFLTDTIGNARSIRVQLQPNWSNSSRSSHHKSSANACQKRAKETRKLRSEALFSDNSWNFRHNSLLSFKPPTTDIGPRQAIIRSEKKSYQSRPHNWKLAGEGDRNVGWAW